jgi:hypothetical protein
MWITDLECEHGVAHGILRTFIPTSRLKAPFENMKSCTFENFSDATEDTEDTESQGTESAASDGGN